LWHKISDEKPPCGERMPLRMGKLPPRVVGCVTQWIESLARDASVDRDSAPIDASPRGASDATDAARD
jgi:hypothetical protein